MEPWVQTPSGSDRISVHVASYCTIPVNIPPPLSLVSSCPLSFLPPPPPRLCPPSNPPSTSHPHNDFGNPQPQVVPTQLFWQGPNAAAALVNWDCRDYEMEGERDGGKVRGEMGWQWPHSQEGDCRGAWLLRSGRMLIPWIYTHTMFTLGCSRICDCTPEIHFLLMCVQARTRTLVYLLWITDPHFVTALTFTLLSILYITVHNHIVVNTDMSPHPSDSTIFSVYLKVNDTHTQTSCYYYKHTIWTLGINTV